MTACIQRIYGDQYRHMYTTSPTHNDDSVAAAERGPISHETKTAESCDGYIRVIIHDIAYLIVIL